MIIIIGRTFFFLSYLFCSFFFLFSRLNYELVRPSENQDQGWRVWCPFWPHDGSMEPKRAWNSSRFSLERQLGKKVCTAPWRRKNTMMVKDLVLACCVRSGSVSRHGTPLNKKKKKDSRTGYGTNNRQEMNGRGYIALCSRMYRIPAGPTHTRTHTRTYWRDRHRNFLVVNIFWGKETGLINTATV